MANPVVDLLVVGHDAQSEYENAFISEVVDPEKNKEKPGGILLLFRGGDAGAGGDDGGGGGCRVGDNGGEDDMKIQDVNQTTEDKKDKKYNTDIRAEMIQDRL